MKTEQPKIDDNDQDQAQPIRRRYGEQEDVAPRATQGELGKDAPVELGRGARLVNPDEEYHQRLANR